MAFLRHGLAAGLNSTMGKIILLITCSLSLLTCGISNKTATTQTAGGRDNFLQDKTQNILWKTLKKDKLLTGGMISIADVNSGEIIAHASVFRHGKTGKMFIAPDLSDTVALFPGAIMETATLAHMMDKKGLSLDQLIPTNHGIVDSYTLPYNEMIEDYEARTGRDSISIKDAYLNTASYMPYYLAQKHLTKKKGYDAFYEDVLLYFGHSNNQWIPRYGSREFTTNMPHTVAAGHSLQLSQKQVLRFYSMIARGGRMGDEQIVPRDVADSLNALLRKNVRSGYCAALSKNSISIAGKSGNLVLFSAPVMEMGGFGSNHYPKGTSFAGYYPSDRPKYSIMITLFCNKEYTAEQVLSAVEQIVETTPGIDTGNNGD